MTEQTEMDLQLGNGAIQAVRQKVEKPLSLHEQRKAREQALEELEKKGATDMLRAQLEKRFGPQLVNQAREQALEELEEAIDNETQGRLDDLWYEIRAEVVEDWEPGILLHMQEILEKKPLGEEDNLTERQE
jgi:hypothetical protein